MAILVATRGDSRHVVPAAGWSEQDIAGVTLAYQADGYDVHIGTGVL